MRGMEVYALSTAIEVRGKWMPCYASSSHRNLGLSRSKATFLTPAPGCLASCSTSASTKLQESFLSPHGYKRDCRSSAIWVGEFGTGSFLLVGPGLVQNGKSTFVKSCGNARAYREDTNPVLSFLNKVRGALPVVGLISRLASPEGGVGTDRVRFEEFCTRVGRNCNSEDTNAFYLFQDRYGKVAKVPFVLIWCWAAAVGAGLLRSEDVLLSAGRLRASYDLEYEVENLDLLMDEATKKRVKSGSKAPNVSMEARAEKALEAICKCCTGRSNITEEDAPLLTTILKAVFPTAHKEAIDLAVAARLVDPYNAMVSNLDKSQTMDEHGKEEEPSQRNSSGRKSRGEQDLVDQQSKLAK